MEWRVGPMQQVTSTERAEEKHHSCDMMQGVEAELGRPLPRKPLAIGGPWWKGDPGGREANRAC